MYLSLIIKKCAEKKSFLFACKRRIVNTYPGAAASESETNQCGKQNRVKAI